MAEKNEGNGRTGGGKRTVSALGIVCAALLAVGFLCRARILDYLRLAEDTKEEARQEDAEAKDGLQNHAAENDGPQNDGAANDGPQNDAAANDGSQNDAAANGGLQNHAAAKDGPQNDGAENDGLQNGSADRDKGRYITDDDAKGPNSQLAGPRSAFFRRIAEIIWEKDPEDISGEEYAGLTSIQIDRTGGLVSYQLNHGFVGTFACPEGLEADFSDLASFGGLEWISVDGSLDPEDLRGLGNLTGIRSRNTVKEFAKILPYPERITELGIEGDSSEKNLEGIEAFPNLQYLSVRYEGIEDISLLERFTGLRGLILEGCGQLRDYGPLLALGDLEWLRISACGLESVDFIKNMPKLVSLSLEDVVITDWAEGLFGIPTLQYLYLNGCRMGMDFDRMPVNETLEVLSLNGVTVLENPAREDSGRVSLSEHGDIFACFPNLKELYLVSLGLEDIGFVEELPHLQYLDITGNSVRDMEPLEHLKELRGIGCGEGQKWGDIFLM